MNTDSLIAQIQSIEVQLAILKAQIKQLGPPPQAKTLGDLAGILAEHGDFTEEEIDAALYDLPWEDWEDEENTETAE